MRLNQLASRITLLMVLAIGLFLTTVSATTFWLVSELNGRAEADARIMVRGAVSDVESALQSTALDHSIWTTAYQIMMAQDAERIYAEYASGATYGDVMHLLALTDGPFDSVQSWRAGGPEQPAPDLVPDWIIDAMRARVAEVAVGSAEVPLFYAALGEEPYLFAGTRVEHEEPESIGNPEPSSYPLAVFGYRLGEELLTEIGERYLLGDLRVSATASDGRSSLPLAGADGAPVAWLAWDAPAPGTDLLHRLLAPLLVVLAIFILTVTAATRLVRQSADELVRQEARAATAARTDALTGLPNRLALHETLDQAEEQGEAAILFFDLNGFKRVNDAVGHQDGDVLVQQVADRLRAIEPAPDFLGRVGGDEFVMVVTGPDAKARIRALGERIRQQMMPQFKVSNRSFRVTASIGCATREALEVDLKELLRRADLAMYHGKNRGTTEPVSYATAIDHLSSDTLSIEEALHEALERPEEFSILYQPILDAASGQMVRAEALARWESAALGPVGPDRFIPVAEECSLILDIGRILCRQICSDLQRWPDLQVSLNISPIQINNGDFVRELIGMLREMQIDPRRIEIELTESVIASNAELAAFKLDQLREAGFSTSLDDFGTGFSSIGYLKRLPFDTVKIDRSFMHGFPGDQRAEHMVRSIIMLCRSLDLTVVCEGVETAEQAELLRGYGCDRMQGHHFSRPMPVEALAEFRTVERPLRMVASGGLN